LAVPGEGALSVQRALHLAGARAMLSTLWHVDDAAGRLFLADFFGRLRDAKGGRLEALRSAQRAALRREANQRKAHPGVPHAPAGAWAAFVLSGDWR
jgi:CHAT domain-containing protein